MSENQETGISSSSSGSRGLAKFQEGVVVSDKMDKSIVVKVTTHKMHPKYKKFLLSSKKYHAHDEENKCGIGDIVKIVETRPLSKKKRWRLKEVVKKSL